MHSDTAVDTGDERRIVVMNDGAGVAYLAIGIPRFDPDDRPELGPRYEWTIANKLDRHDLMVLSSMLHEVGSELPWVDVDENGKHHVAVEGSTRFSGPVTQ